MAAWNQLEELVDMGENEKWMLDVKCSECNSDAVTCWSCEEYPEECCCTDLYNKVRCLDCHKLVTPSGSDIYADSQGRLRLNRWIDENWTDDEDDIPNCTCDPAPSHYCIECNVWRDHPGMEWEWAEGGSMARKKGKNKKKKNDKAKNSAPSNQNIKKTQATNISKTDWDDPYWWMGGSDRHYGTEVEINGLKLHASSVWNNRKADEFHPDWGLYADWSWKTTWRAEHIDWPDMSIPIDKVIAFEQIVVAVEKVLNGDQVEIGCIGGHGRTGTILAIMGVITGMPAKEAISTVRKDYCYHAIETKRQEWYVEWAEAIMNGTTPPPEPQSFTSSKVTGTTGSSTAPGGHSCTQREHWDMWLDGLAVCKKKGTTCKWYDEDCTKYMAGETPMGIFNKPRVEPYNGTIIVDGCRVPRPSHKSPMHSPGRNLGCRCDVCRYKELGHGAFLMPQESKEAEKWCLQMSELDRQVAIALNKRLSQSKQSSSKLSEAATKLSEAATKVVDEANKFLAASGDDEEEKTTMWVVCADSYMAKTTLNDNFQPRPPTSPGAIGEQIGQFRFTLDYGWVWEGLHKFDPINHKPINGPGGHSNVR